MKDESEKALRQADEAIRCIFALSRFELLLKVLSYFRVVATGPTGFPVKFNGKTLAFAGLCSADDACTGWCWHIGFLVVDVCGFD